MTTSSNAANRDNVTCGDTVWLRSDDGHNEAHVQCDVWSGHAGQHAGELVAQDGRLVECRW